MKKSVKPDSKQPKPSVNTKAANTKAAPDASPAVKLNHAERARQRAEASRKAALNKVVSQSPD